MSAGNSTWSDVVAAKREERETRLGKYKLADSNSPDSADLISAGLVDIEAITALLLSKQQSAEDLTRAFIQRACEAQRTTNCLTEICFDEAIEQAKQLDGYLEAHGRLIGPLHGVPVSLKDQFNIKGFDSTLGYVGRAFQPADADAPLVQTLKQLGAVVIAKTNLPQSIMWCETDNPLWGLTTHPADAKLTPGGSSGGEAALLSLGGSVIGWGTDIGGSIRIPSHMTGLWGLKPSSGRLSYKGVAVTLDGQQHVPSAVGPMAPSLSSLTQVAKLMIEAQPWVTDPNVPPVPWRNDVFQELSTRKLVIGVMPDDGIVRPHPPIERLMARIVDKLRVAGHEIVEWDASLNAQCIQIMDEYYSADGGEDIRRGVGAGGEPFVPQIQAFVNRGQPISVYQYWQVNKRKVASQQAYHDAWDRARQPPVDILLVPTMPHTAVAHGSCRWTGYTKLFNFLDYTALTFPAGVADGIDIGRAKPEHSPRNPIDAANWDLYDPAAMCGLPIGLQIVGRRFDEEKVLGVAAQLQKLL